LTDRVRIRHPLDSGDNVGRDALLLETGHVVTGGNIVKALQVLIKLIHSPRSHF
jgi:hypothetical protein